jgi:hypothetical protein
LGTNVNYKSSNHWIFQFTTNSEFSKPNVLFIALKRSFFHNSISGKMSLLNRNRLTKLDAFTKTVEDARIRTTSGGFVTITSVLVILGLVWAEWSTYRRIVVRPELVVDKSRGERMEIFLNATFPKIPCELLTLDVMDVSGDVQTGVQHGIKKVRLGSVADGGHELEIKDLQM